MLHLTIFHHEINRPNMTPHVPPSAIFPNCWPSTSLIQPTLQRDFCLPFTIKLQYLAIVAVTKVAREGITSLSAASESFYATDLRGSQIGQWSKHGFHDALIQVGIL